MFERKTPDEPTPDQCSERTRFAWDGFQAMACWYPQMGGYVGKCVVVNASDPDADCFDAYVWHDGAFPFSDDGEGERRQPVRIHHCIADQFIGFGNAVLKLQGYAE